MSRGCFTELATASAWIHSLHWPLLFHILLCLPPLPVSLKSGVLLTAATLVLAFPAALIAASLVDPAWKRASRMLMRVTARA